MAAANSTSIRKVRSEADIAAVKALVWEFFDVIRDRYPDMLDTIDRYIAEQDVEGQLANFARVFLPPAGECLVADHDGEQVGMIMLKPLPDKACEMNRMYVRDTARGHQLGLFGGDMRAVVILSDKSLERVEIAPDHHEGEVSRMIGARRAGQHLDDAVGRPHQRNGGVMKEPGKLRFLAGMGGDLKYAHDHAVPPVDHETPSLAHRAPAPRRVLKPS